MVNSSFTCDTVHLLTCSGAWLFDGTRRKESFIDFLSVSTPCLIFDHSRVEFEFGRRMNEYLQLNCQLASKASSSCLPLAGHFYKIQDGVMKMDGDENNECMQQKLITFFNSKQTKSMPLKNLFLFPIVNHRYLMLQIQV